LFLFLCFFKNLKEISEPFLLKQKTLGKMLTLEPFLLKQKTLWESADA
jgi:hypothetical protein